MTDRRTRNRQQQLRAKLATNRDDLDRVTQQQDELRAARAELIRKAHEAGLGVTELAELTGISRRAVYDVLNEGGND